jgi:hypothetical protein
MLSQPPVHPLRARFNTLLKSARPELRGRPFAALVRETTDDGMTAGGAGPDGSYLIQKKLMQDNLYQLTMYQLHSLRVGIRRKNSRTDHPREPSPRGSLG